MVDIGGIMTSRLPRSAAGAKNRVWGCWKMCSIGTAARSGSLRAGWFGYAGTYSFFVTKLMTSGEGGMVVTDDDAVADKVRLLRYHGKPQPWVSDHTELGANWRMCEFAACVGVFTSDGSTSPSTTANA